jgi:GNAT superfamily N-acetyltransferase
MAAQAEVEILKKEQLEDWFDHLEECFQVKGTPRIYFVHHFADDPWKAIDTIYITTSRSPSSPELPLITSTVRVYQRRIYNSTTATNTSTSMRTISVGGIGEVSTKPQFRGQGLAPRLLQRACASMAVAGQIGLLHTSQPTLQEYYAKLNWMHAPIVMVTVKCELAAITAMASNQTYSQHGLRIGRLEFCDDQVLIEIMRIYTNSACMLNGPLVRDDPEYWTRWIRYQCERLDATIWTLSSTNRVEAYMITSWDRSINPPRLQVHEIFSQQDFELLDNAPVLGNWLCWFISTVIFRCTTQNPGIQQQQFVEIELWKALCSAGVAAALNSLTARENQQTMQIQWSESVHQGWMLYGTNAQLEHTSFELFLKLDSF